MSIYTSQTSCGASPITSIAFRINAQRNGFAERPLCQCGKRQPSAQQPTQQPTTSTAGTPTAADDSDRIREVYCETGFRGFETFHDDNTQNVTQVVLFPNSNAEPEVIRCNPSSLTQMRKSAHVKLDVGNYANVAKFTVGPASRGQPGALKHFSLEFVTSTLSQSGTRAWSNLLSTPLSDRQKYTLMALAVLFVSGAIWYMNRSDTAKEKDKRSRDEPDY